MIRTRDVNITASLISFSPSLSSSISLWAHGTTPCIFYSANQLSNTTANRMAKNYPNLSLSVFSIPSLVPCPVAYLASAVLTRPQKPIIQSSHARLLILSLIFFARFGVCFAHLESNISVAAVL